MVDDVTLYPSTRDKVASKDPICLICPATEFCSTAKADLPPKKVCSPAIPLFCGTGMPGLSP